MSAPYYADESVTLYLGDCLEVMRTLPDGSVDAVVTDPPYGLGFMGRAWDDLPPGLPWATECLRVLKPGGYLLAFGGSRTWHRLACAVEDAGFEMRDSIAWLYGSGFAKSWNFRTQYSGEWCSCNGRNALPLDHAGNPEMRGLRDLIHPSPLTRREGEGTHLFSSVQRSEPGTGLGAARVEGSRSVVAGSGCHGAGEDDGAAEPGVGRRVIPGRQGVSPSADAGAPERAAERVRPGTRAGDDEGPRSGAGATGGGAPHQSGAGRQPAGEPKAVPGSPVALDGGALRDGAVCARCGGLAEEFRGFGSALKPAFEPVVVARKPLVGTVAANVLAHGTGALNVDGCRVPMSESDAEVINSMGGFGVAGYVNTTSPAYGTNDAINPLPRTQASAHPAGRWPTNVVLDDSQAAELDRQSGIIVGRNGGKGGWREEYVGGERAANIESSTYRDSGGASRFFPTFHYEAKAPTSERPRVKKAGGSDNATTYGQMKTRECNVCGSRANPAGGSHSGKPWPSCGHEDWSWVEQQSSADEYVAHPTVKPLDLMRWLVRLVTPPGGTVLEPFAGSGTTAEACVIEGFRCIAIEREATYLPLIVARLSKPIALALDLGGAA